MQFPKYYYLLLVCVSIIVMLLVVSFQSSPGYMDAEYYFSGGKRLASGYGFSELILWNYLDEPVGLPHPSHKYWMPLASLLAAMGMKLVMYNFSGARLGFIIIGILLPVLVTRFSFSLTKNQDYSILSGLFAIFSGFYLPYLPTTDVFGIYMLLGILFLMAGVWASKKPVDNKYVGWSFCSNWLLVGLISGVMQLSRADGILWFLTGIIWTILAGIKKGGAYPRFQWLFLSLIGVFSGYLIIMIPWFWRNYLLFDGIFSPGSFHTLWIREYNELFLYPSSILTKEYWWQSGLESIISTRLWAASQNLLSTLIVQGNIVLTPFIVMGFWRFRKNPTIQVGCFVWLSTFLLMTVIFPDLGVRGGFFHSGSAIQPLFWLMAPIGLNVFLEWMNKRRKWKLDQTMKVFGVSFVIVTILISTVVVKNRVIGNNLSHPAWDDEVYRYQMMEEALSGYGAKPGQIVMVNNAPGYFSCNNRPAISIPNVNLENLLVVAEKYHASYLLLEFNQLREDDLYTFPKDLPGLQYLGGVENTRIYQFIHYE